MPDAMLCMCLYWFLANHTKQSQAYFYDHNTGVATYDDPRYVEQPEPSDALEAVRPKHIDLPQPETCLSLFLSTDICVHPSPFPFPLFPFSPFSLSPLSPSLPLLFLFFFLPPPHPLNHVTPQLLRSQRARRRSAFQKDTVSKNVCFSALLHCLGVFAWCLRGL